MQDKVGSKIPSEKEIDELVAEIKAIEGKVEKYTVLLSKEERAATTKFRKGGEEVVSVVSGLADDHEVRLPKISTEGMRADLLLAQRIRPLCNAVSGLGQRLDDTYLEAQSECWWAATAFYTALARLSGAEPRVEAALRPVVEFFALGRRKKGGEVGA